MKADWHAVLNAVVLLATHHRGLAGVETVVLFENFQRCVEVALERTRKKAVDSA